MRPEDVAPVMAVAESSAVLGEDRATCITEVLFSAVRA